MRKLFIAVIIILLSAVAFGCNKNEDSNASSDEVSSYEYTQEYSKIKNLCGSDWLVNGSLDVTSAYNNTYKFDKSISEEERVCFIDTQVEINSFLQDKGILIEGFDFYVLHDIEIRVVKEENRAYIDFDALKSTEHIKLTLQAFWGEYTNFGYVFALSEHILQELGWGAGQESAEIDLEIFKQTPELLNLSYPVFLEKYASRSQISAAKELSKTLLALMENCYSGPSDFEEEIIE